MKKNNVVTNPVTAAEIAKFQEDVKSLELGHNEMKTTVFDLKENLNKAVSSALAVQKEVKCLKLNHNETKITVFELTEDLNEMKESMKEMKTLSIRGNNHFISITPTLHQ